jgi:hypothetical protein
MGGKAASQGTGITSGLDEKVNMAIGGGVIEGDNLGKREGFQSPSFNELLQSTQNMTPSQLNLFLAERAGSGGAGLQDMREIVKLQALSNLAGNVLPNIERGGLEGVVDFFRDPATTQTALAGLTGLKQVDITGKRLQDKALADFVKNQISIEGSKADRKMAQDVFDLNLKKFEADENYKKETLRLKEKQLEKTSKSATIQNYNAAKTLLAETNLSESQKMDLLLGVLTRGSYQTVSSRKADLEKTLAQAVIDGSLSQSQVDKMLDAFEETNLSIFDQPEKDPMATGGRVGRAMGTPMMGEQPQQMTEQQDVAMETQGQGNNVYAMLRARLPQEVSDEVVKLISYNKEAFADFASIKNQEDVSSFNEKYGVQLVIDVATV